MRHIQKKLGEAELEIMQVIWDSENPVTSKEKNSVFQPQ